MLYIHSLSLPQSLKDRPVTLNVDRRTPCSGALLLRDLAPTFPGRALQHLSQSQLLPA